MKGRSTSGEENKQENPINRGTKATQNVAKNDDSILSIVNKKERERKKETIEE